MEVERKFRVTAENPFVNLEEGEYFVRKEELLLLDQYFDNSSFELTVNDHWLRQRTVDSSRGVWEIKYRHALPQDGVEERHCTQYMETSDIREIASCIRRVLAAADGASFEEILESLQCWCAIRTTRRTHELKVHAYGSPITVVLDSFDGKHVGEVEIILPENSTPEEVHRAEGAVDAVFSRFALEDASGGKVENFIREQKPELFDKLKHLLTKN
ncbi:thiamine-triphosphatase [Galendromus occidentalis]|uniref:Thiamine-triphosphatase n=1 Tax=Galendromus occidentalis TaxID=34638 RepID=A0AAJ6QUV5_9ACAR|nr:thiamine-triphosphatase [Galendromus occidentalis]